jgi:Poly-beta-hydroxybutyrate polymerase N terminal
VAVAGSGRDPDAVTATVEIIERSLHASVARFTMGVSPAALAMAYFVDRDAKERRDHIELYPSDQRRENDAKTEPTIGM